MKTTYRTNLRCQNCVHEITPILDGDETVKSWSADVSLPDKRLTVETTTGISPHHVVGLMKKAGFEAAPIDGHQAGAVTTPSSTQAHSSGWLATYKPLLLVLSYVLGITIFIQWIVGRTEPNWENLSLAMSHFMGFFFLGFAFFKLLNVTAFADVFGTYDIIAKRSRAYGLAYPFIELALGLVFLSNQFPAVSSLATIVVMGIGLIGVMAAVQKKQAIQCACLGTVFNLPMSIVTIIENSVMILMAAVMLAMQGS